MAVVKKVDFKLKVDINVSIKYQILTYCFFNDVLLTKTDLEFLLFGQNIGLKPRDCQINQHTFNQS